MHGCIEVCSGLNFTRRRHFDFSLDRCWEAVVELDHLVELVGSFIVAKSDLGITKLICMYNDLLGRTVRLTHVHFEGSMLATSFRQLLCIIRIYLTVSDAGL